MRRPPLLPVAATPPCTDCSRRALLVGGLGGLGIAAASSLLGCGGEAEPPPPDAAVVGGVEMCGADVCLDLAHEANAALLEPGGQRAITVPGDRVVIVRTTATEFAVLSRVCTHAACSVSYSTASMLLQCPCHGSRFTLTGAVERGPASSPLRRYAYTFDATTQLLTITL